MSQEPPPKITDKRKQRAAEAQAKAAASDPLPSASEETVLTVNRLERIHELRQKAVDGDALTEDDRNELLRLQVEESAAEDEERKQDANTVPARTAFYVILMHDGSVKSEPDCNVMLELDHLATIDEMYTGVSMIQRDIQAAMAAKHTVFQLQQQASAGMSRRLQPPGGIVPPGRR